jgi:hypothetical protein
LDSQDANAAAKCRTLKRAYKLLNFLAAGESSTSTPICSKPTSLRE